MTLTSRTSVLRKGAAIRICVVLLSLMMTAGVRAQEPELVEQEILLPDSISVTTVCVDTLTSVTGERIRVFNPEPMRAVWLSALCPGLGQIYNRRYWKLPIIVGGYMGLTYATDWNNAMLRDYTKAYRDLMDNDPDTKSYMDFFAPGVDESSLNKAWLESVFQSRRNYFRRNRDLCIIGMVGVYLLAIVDAYVDASLAHFDITPELSMHWSPVIMQETRSPIPSVGLQMAFCF